MHAFQLILLFFSLYLTSTTGALASIIITPGPAEQDISKEFFLGSGTGHKNEKTSLRFGYFSGEKWARVTLLNPSAQHIEKLIYFDTLTGKIELYDQNSQFLGVSGSSIPFNKRAVKSVFAGFKISLLPNAEKTFFLKIVSRHNFNSKVFVGNYENLINWEQGKLFFLDFYAGGILCLLFYNFFIFLFLKDKNYLFYCLFSLSFMLPILNIHGVLDKIFVTETFSFSHYLICFSAMALMSAIVFTYNFLELSKNLPKVKRYFQIVFFICLGVFVLGLTSASDLAPAFFGNLIDFLLITTNLAFIICSVLLLKTSSMARFYLFSWVVLGASLLCWFGMTFGILPNNFFTQHALLYSSLGQMLMLSLALAYRIHIVTQEKLLAEEKALQKDKYHRLVRVLSHDIANSLTIVNSYTKKLIKPKNLDPSVQRILEKIYLAAENIRSILKNVREEELLAERKKSIELHPVNIHEHLLAASVAFEEHLKNKNLEMIIDVPADATILANKTCFLNNIVNNIISNAIKFSYENSKIEISTKRSTDKIAVTFKDYGQGIDPQLIRDIFHSSKLITTNGTKGETGHGFGASIMREYVELFGGKLEVSSSFQEEAASGTSVTIIFPASIN